MTQGSIAAADWTLHLARCGDAEYLPDIERSADLLFANDRAPAARLPIFDTNELRAYIARGRSLVVRIGPRIIGFVIAEPAGRELHIVQMAVHADFQRQGIGSGMIRALIVDSTQFRLRRADPDDIRRYRLECPVLRRFGLRCRGRHGGQSAAESVA